MAFKIEDVPTTVWTNDVFEDADPRLLARFKLWLSLNPRIYDLFEHVAEETLKKRKKYSAWVIVNVARWHHDIETTGNEFKFNNDFIAPMARLLIVLRPEFKQFFGLRLMKKRRRTLPQVTVDPARDPRQVKLPLTEPTDSKD